MDDGSRQVRRRVADLVATAQRRRAVSAVELAELSGVALVEVERLMHAEADLRLDVIYRIAGVLEVKPSDLLQGIEWVPDGTGDGRFRLDEEEKS